MRTHIAVHPPPPAISRTSGPCSSSLLASVLKFQLTPCSIWVSQSLRSYLGYLTWRVVRLFFFFFLSPPPPLCNKHYVMNWFSGIQTILFWLFLIGKADFFFFKSDGRREGWGWGAPLVSQFRHKGSGELIRYCSWRCILDTTLKEWRLPAFTQ